ncbi:class I adenylate-forming enzyme family protein [Curtobacterium ammoniigenes]|uniref:class I adenylate-forming enzyme family protein n=1 Tax=Curtobacterium ammoniigenes TaxID=395387 RepID=UPI00082C3A7C|nr:AMP-binding protein [Curtobacterium ammoniigenes]
MLQDRIESQAGRRRDHPYLEDARSGRRVTYRDLHSLTGSWRELFIGLGLAPSAAVLVDVADPLTFAVVHLSAIAGGFRAVPVDPGQPASETTRLADLIGGASVVVSDREASSAVPGVAFVRVDPDTFLPSVAIDGQAPASNPEALTTGSVVLFTSGSTGTPKGVELPEPQLLFVADQVAEHNRLSPDDRGFNALPLFHVNAEVVGLLATLAAGATLVLDRRFRRTGFWQLLAERRITWLNAVPAVLAVLSKTGPLELPPGLRFVRSASAPLPDPVRDALGDIPLVVSWGMTEGASQITATPLDAPRRPGTVGLPVGCEVEVRDDAGRPLGPDTVGALWVRGPGIVNRYLFGRAPERFDADGWLSTGDVGSIAADGWVTLAGRSDDVINRGGEKVYPSEVEDVLLGDDRVLEAVVVARPDEVLGAVPVAYVIPHPTAADLDALAADLADRCVDQLARFRRPVEITVVDDLPRAPTGKIQRAKVRALADGAPADGD